MLYIFRQPGIDFLLQGPHRIGVCGQTVEDVTESDAGRLIAAEDKDEGLGKDFVLSQACKKNNSKEVLVGVFLNIIFKMIVLMCN